MNEELNYAEMLEIPVETVTVKRKERKRRPAPQESELSNKLVEQVNDRMEEADDPAYAESREIERTGKPAEKKSKLARRLIIGEFVVVCALCLTIFLTNIFMANSAINTFVRGLFQGQTAAAAADERTYTDFKLSPVINDYTETEINVSDTGVLSFTAKCSVYAPCEGTLKSVNGDAETGMTVELKHSDSFSTIISGLDAVYYGEGQSVKSNVPLGYSDGEGSVRVMFYSNGSLLNCYTLGEGEIAWS